MDLVKISKYIFNRVVPALLGRISLMSCIYTQFNCCTSGNVELLRTRAFRTNNLRGTYGPWRSTEIDAVACAEHLIVELYKKVNFLISLLDSSYMAFYLWWIKLQCIPCQVIPREVSPIRPCIYDLTFG